MTYASFWQRTADRFFQRKYLWAVPSISEYAACYISHTSMEIAKKNYLELKKMNNYDAIKSNHFISILKSYEENKSDFLIKH